MNDQINTTKKNVVFFWVTFYITFPSFFFFHRATNLIAWIHRRQCHRAGHTLLNATCLNYFVWSGSGGLELCWPPGALCRRPAAHAESRVTAWCWSQNGQQRQRDGFQEMDLSGKSLIYQVSSTTVLSNVLSRSMTI